MKTPNHGKRVTLFNNRFDNMGTGYLALSTLPGPWQPTPYVHVVRCRYSRGWSVINVMPDDTFVWEK